MIILRLSQPADTPALADIWTRSVRATHHFLDEAAFEEISQIVTKTYLPAAPLWVAEHEGGIAGFMGLTGPHIDSLFLDPDLRGQGIGRQLVEHAFALNSGQSVDVNEQNPEATAFYKHMGFRVVRRSETDDQGRPFPILHLTR
ncbi:MAG: acetyltransferase [Asticcacaulis sp.]